VEPFAAHEPRTHLALLGAGVVIVEGLDLRRVPAGSYELLCLPVVMAGRDGAPARVLLRATG
jgi:arylformamidase